MKECFKIEQGLLIFDSPNSSGTALNFGHKGQRPPFFESTSV